MIQRRMLTPACCRQHMALTGQKFDPIWERIEDLVVLSLLAIVPQLRFQYAMARPAGDPQSVCFELLGYDILIDELRRSVFGICMHAGLRMTHMCCVLHPAWGFVCFAPLSHAGIPCSMA